MSLKSRFSHSEWEELQLTIAAVTQAMMEAQPGGELIERLALPGIEEAVLEEFHQTQLVHLLFAQSEEEAIDLKAHLEEISKRNARGTRANVVDLCRRALTLLREKGLAETEIAAFRGAVLALADKVARAGKEGGFLGIVGQKISGAESDLLQSIARAME